jgi:prepilin-type processing-associated H-X9-DG protein
MRFSLRTLFALVAFVAFTAVLFWVGRGIYSNVRRNLEKQSSDNLRQIGIAFQSYQQAYRKIPPTYVADPNGESLYSWRFAILPFLDSLVPQMPDPRKPWNHPSNLALSGQTIHCFHAPLDDLPKTMTTYLAVVGPGTAWSVAASLDNIKHPEKAILVVEVFNSGINWVEPRDTTPEAAITALHDHCGHVLFADGHVEKLPAGIDAGTLKEMLTAR